MLPSEQGRIARILLIAFFLAFLIYGAYEARLALLGPTIEMGVSGVQTVHTPKILIEGTVQRVISLTINGRTIPLGKDGSFSEEVLVSPGYNVFTLSAADRGGRVSEEVLQVFYEHTTPPRSSTLATSSPETYER